MSKIYSGESKKLLSIVIISIFFLLLAFSLFMGNYHIPAKRILRELIYRFIPGKTSVLTDTENLIIFHIRFPRALFVILAGAGLGITGGAAQGLFKNPLISPMILGISSGAALGASFGILFFNGIIFWVQFFSFAGAVAAVGIACFLSRSSSPEKSNLVTLILSGVLVGTFFQALTGVLKYWADTDYQLPAITFWMMGGFDGITWTDLYPRIFIIIPGSILLIAAGFKIDILSLGDEEAKSLGQNVRFLKAMIILLISLITASIVSGCGIIGWVGLAVPHMMRMLLGPSHGRLLIWSGFTGAAVLLAADLLARTITSGEIPIGIITAFMGAPFFAWLLYKKSDDLWK